MKNSLSANLNQKQNLSINLNTLQSLNILQMNLSQLDSLIHEMQDENPTLEVNYPKEIDYIEYIKNISNENNQYIGENLNNETDFFSKTGYYDCLLNHLGLIKEDDKKVLELAKVLIYQIDENGYFISPLQKLAFDNNSDLCTTKKAVKLIRRAVPAGIAAFNLSDCLILQLRENKIEDSILYEIVKYNLKDIALRNYNKILKEHKISGETLNNYIEIIMQLDPKPGRVFSEAITQNIIPDLKLEIKDDKFYVNLNNDVLPELKISKFYEKLVRQQQEKSTIVYITENINKSYILIKNIERRNKTIKKVAQEIVNWQERFFKFKDNQICPMTMGDISNKTNLHESTISRAVNGKYILTPRGIIELKDLFSQKVCGNKKESFSSEQIKLRIREIISKENKLKPLSDEKISYILKSEGAGISRRTVAKYRNEIGILPACNRKSINF